MDKHQLLINKHTEEIRKIADEIQNDRDKIKDYENEAINCDRQIKDAQSAIDNNKLKVKYEEDNAAFKNQQNQSIFRNTINSDVNR